MLKYLPVAVLAALFAGYAGVSFLPSVSAQETAAAPVDEALLARGQQLYSDNCASCHQIAGTGSPPVVPALAGNGNLSDVGLIAGNVHNGKNAMPPFPNLTAADIAALATYVRNTWGNSFGGVTEEEVAGIIGAGGEAATGEAGAAPAAAAGTIWDGVYTEEQAERGAQVISGTCAKCHGTRLNGAGQPDQPPSPAIARAGFLTKWDGRNLQTLFEYIHTQMPLDNPGQLTEQQVADALAQMLAVSGAPAGSTELSADPAALAGITITPKAE